MKSKKTQVEELRDLTSQTLDDAMKAADAMAEAANAQAVQAAKVYGKLSRGMAFVRKQRKKLRAERESLEADRETLEAERKALDDRRENFLKDVKAEAERIITTSDAYARRKKAKTDRIIQREQLSVVEITAELRPIIEANVQAEFDVRMSMARRVMARYEALLLCLQKKGTETPEIFDSPYLAALKRAS